MKTAKTHRKKPTIFIFIAGFIAIAFWISANKEPDIHHAQFTALGTLIELSARDIDDDKSDVILNEIQTTLDDIHNSWHAWKPSRLTEINNNIHNQGAILNKDERAILKQAIKLAENSDHLFNPLLGQLISLWGFQNDAPPDTPPSDEAIHAFMQAPPAIGDLSWENGRLTTQHPSLYFDLGGFAKGYAIDQAVEILKQHGVEHAIVNAGGDLRAIGNAGERPWRIGIRDPRGAGVFALVETRNDESVFTSGDYERFFEYRGQRYHHLLDPRNGYPATASLSVTVIHPDAGTADAAATAIFVAGPKDWLRIAAKMGVRQVMLVDQHRTVYMSADMVSRIQFLTDPPPATVIRSIP